MHVAESFGDMIRKRRIALGLTQQELAQQIGCARVTIQKIEAHQRHPSVALAQRLAHYLHLIDTEWTTLFRARKPDIQSGTIHTAVSAKLPVLPNPLLGREEEISTLCDQLIEPKVRLLTIVGPPGVGKTSLAIHVATLLQQHYHHNVIWLSLASKRNPELILYEVAQALEVREVSYQSLFETIQSVISQRQVLLLFDNFEHLMAASPMITQLLACNTHLNLLVTSRTRLGIGGEYTFTVAPLQLPSNTRTSEQELLLQSPAVRLFVERAQAVHRHFTLTEDNAMDVAKICRRLDGLPLAIELAAARSAALTPSMLLDQLEQQLDILADGARHLPPRQQTLDAAIAWSYDLLTDREQQLLQYLAVFAQGERLAAIVAVCGIHRTGTDEEVQLIRTLDSLIQHSLVYTTVAVDGEMCYVMLETIRSYVRKQLMSHADVSVLLRRHAEYYYQFMKQASTHFNGPDAKIWVSRLIEAFPNLRLAFQWLIEHDVVETAHFIVASNPLLDRCAHVTEGRQWITDVLERSGDDVIEPFLQAELHQMAGNLAYMQGEYHLGQNYLKQALKVYTQIHHLPGMAKITNHLGNLVLRQGKYDEASMWYTQSLTWSREDNNQHTIARALYGLAGLAGALTNWEEAEALHRQTLELRMQLGDSWGMALNLLGLGHVLWQCGQVDQARELCERSLTLWRQSHDLRGIAGALHALGHIALAHGQLEQAHGYFVESTRIWRQLGMVLELGWSLDAFACLAVHQNQRAHTSELFTAATAIRLWLQSPRTPSEYLQLTLVVQADREFDHLPADVSLSMSEIQMILDEILAEA